MRLRGLVRGTIIAWPYAGRALAIGQDVARPYRRRVLVRVDVSAISPGTERAFFMRMPNAMTKFPYFPGYSAAGEVVAVGRGVRRFRPGDRVALAAEHGSIAVADESSVHAVPEGVSLEDAAFVQLGVIALQAVLKAQLRGGEPAVVLGQGLIGQLLAQFASAYGAYPVIAVTRTAKRVTDHHPHGVQEVIVLDRDGTERLDRLGAAVTFEATGSPDALPLAMQCTRPGGRIVLAGSTRGVTQKTDFGLLADKALTVVGAHVTSVPESAWLEHAQVFFNLLEQRRLDLAPLITERVDPLEAEWFYRRLSRKDDATIGAVFCWDRLQPAERMRRVSFLALPDFAPLKHGRMASKPFAKPGPRGQEGAASG